MIRLSNQQIQNKVDFIKSYVNEGNAADASKVDSNANVTSKNIATLEAELYKDYNIQINRAIVSEKIREMYDDDLADEYNRQIEAHEIYVHDETSLKPYTYGPTESIVVLKNGKKLLTTFKLLYDSYTDLEECLLSETDGAYAKYPTDLFIFDYNGTISKINRLVRKARKRDLCRIKTKFGEDLIVTDNHPMIVDNKNLNDTVSAIESIGKPQYKSDIVFNSDINIIDAKNVFNYDNYGSYLISNINDGSKVEGIKTKITLSDKLGYFIGFFIAEGSITNDMVIVTQANSEILKKIASYLFDATGLIGKIYKDASSSHSDRTEKWKLQYNSKILIELIQGFFGISKLAEYKNLPINIYETNKLFVDGLLSGLIDGDGCVTDDAISIRVASRALISECAVLLRSFNFGFSMSYQEQSEIAFNSFSSNYPIFGISFNMNGNLLFSLCEKIKNNDNIKNKKNTRYLTNSTTIKSVNIINNESYLNTDIYDITTDTGTFICNNLLVHNCTSITMYPFLLDGLTKLGGESKSPHHLESFCGSFVNLIFAISSQFAGAVATVEFLMYFDYFAKLDYGDNYLETARDKIENHLQHVVYAINQPAAARGYQCVRESTELLTPEGYKKLSELHVGDKCYVWKNGHLEIESINRLNEYDYDGDMCQFKGRNYQQTVTPNHRVVYKKPNENGYNIKEAHELMNHSKLSLPIGSDGIDRKDYPICDNLLKLCVVALTDGTIDEFDETDSSHNSGRLTIYKSKNRWGYKEIPEMLDEMGIGYSIKDIDSNKFGEMISIRLTKMDSQLILRTIKHTKKEIPYFMKLLSKRQIDIVIDIWSRIDGSHRDLRNDSILLQCDNDVIRNSLQEIVFLGGYGSEIYTRQMKKFNKTELCDVKYVKIFSRKNKRISEYNSVHYKGKVWCPTTNAGVVVFREENGIPYISGNSVFWNISLFDKYYFESMFGEFAFPDDNCTRPTYESVSKLQSFFMSWFNEERTKSLLTFPVVTAAMLTKDEKVKDRTFLNMCAEEASKGNSFFTYLSDSADSLSSCCRLRNEMADNTFSYSLGAGGVSTGSINVITINMNRLVQDGRDLKTEVEKVQKYQMAYRKVMDNYKEKHMLTVYDAGFISLDKQFLTIGINGMVEAAEFKGYKISNNPEYINYVSSLLKIIYDSNKEAYKKYGYKFNTEFVPAENLGVKNAMWDKKDNYIVSRDCYNSYFYSVEDDTVNPVDKIIMHGKDMIKYLDGGSALHLNLEEYLSKKAYIKLFDSCAMAGCNYFTTNVKVTICNDCGYIDKHTLKACSKCGSTNIDYATRVIGYLKRISSFSTARQIEADNRAYSKIKD